MTADIILNLVIFGVTLYLVARLSRKDGKPAPDQLRTAFRFFTVQSNVLCALAALITAVCRLAGNLPGWAWLLKYIGTAAVSVTMVTVFVFLAPSIGKGWVDILLKGGDLFMPGCQGDYKDILAGLESGDLSREQLLINVSRLYRLARELTGDRD